MLKEYVLDTEDEEIIDELDNMCGVIQNKDTLKNMILYFKLRKNNMIDFGNNNVVIRNDSNYYILDDFIKICSKIFLKYKVISNNKICYLDKVINQRKDNPLEMIMGIDEDIVVLNANKFYINDYDKIEKLLNLYKNKVFIFEDTGWMDGLVDARLANLVSWRLTIDRISLDDKIMYGKNLLDKNGLKYKYIDLKEFSDQAFWQVQKHLMKIVIECKSKDINTVTTEMFRKNKGETKPKESIRKNKTIDKDKKTAKQELDELIGLNEIKTQIQKILNYIKINKNREKRPSLHMCFTGNPGTGKTSIARIIGKLFAEENILTGNGEFVEIHGRDLIDKYVGWTAQKVKDTIQKAMGGVLFIDEAYSLISDRRGGYEDEAIATLIKEMEDHREEICIILAGYTNEMKNLIEQNPGFESRIQFTIEFPDYKEEELLEIFMQLCKKEKFKLSNGCKEILLNNFKSVKKEEDFGNGRYVRNLFEKIKFEQADRIVETNSKNMNSIVIQDVKNSLKNMKCNNIDIKRKIGF